MNANVAKADVVVTGGAGFIGANLCRALLAAGRSVLCVDSFACSSPDNVADLLDLPNFRLLRHDVTAPYPVAARRLFNLACRASPVQYQKDPIHTFRTCVLGAQHAIDAVARAGGRLVQASTSEVYGEPLTHPQREEDCGQVSITGPRACYDEGKRAAETLLFDHARMRGLDLGVVRLFNTYGPFMAPDDGRVVSNFVVQALTGRPMTIYGDGSQTRSLCYVDDTVAGLMAMMDAGRAALGPINIGNPCEITVLELATTIGDLVGRKPDIAFRPLPQDDPTRRRPAIERAAEQLGWAPRTDLREGLARTIAYFDRRLSNDAPAACEAAT